MKAIILNGSPRKNWNTAMMLREAQKGAESAGADTEYIDLYDETNTTTDKIIYPFSNIAKSTSQI